PSHGGERLDCRAGGIAPGAGEPTLSSPLASRGGVLGDPDGERRGTPRYAGGGEGVADPDPAGGIRGRRRGGGDRGISAGPGPASPGPGRGRDPSPWLRSPLRQGIRAARGAGGRAGSCDRE